MNGKPIFGNNDKSDKSAKFSDAKKSLLKNAYTR